MSEQRNPSDINTEEIVQEKYCTLSLHIKTEDGGFQIKKKGIILVYYHHGDSGGLRRPLEHRNVDRTFLARRQATIEEMNTESHQYRYDFIRYESWDLLIDDEHKLTNDKEWFERLEVLKAEYPQFNINQHKLTLT